jgi:hypothetical protein
MAREHAGDAFADALAGAGDDDGFPGDRGEHDDSPSSVQRNNASKVLKNVVDAFSKAANLPGSALVSDEKQWR